MFFFVSFCVHCPNGQWTAMLWAKLSTWANKCWIQSRDVKQAQEQEQHPHGFTRVKNKNKKKEKFLFLILVLELALALASHLWTRLNGFEISSTSFLPDCKPSSLETTTLNFWFPKFPVLSIVLLFVSILLVFKVSYFVFVMIWFLYVAFPDSELRIWFFQVWEFFKFSISFFVRKVR